MEISISIMEISIRTNEGKEKIKIFWGPWSKIRDLIRSVTKNSDDYDEKYMKIKFIQMAIYL